MCVYVCQRARVTHLSYISALSSNIIDAFNYLLIIYIYSSTNFIIILLIKYLYNSALLDLNIIFRSTSHHFLS